MSSFIEEIRKRRTFAIISHPDAGKTTITEKLLLYGGAITLAGTVKGRKASRMATSDSLKIEQERGISVATSVMQFPYGGAVFNLLDTPGHEDFSEDTYRTLTAVDSALMVIDVAKGVEARTIKLMEVCRLRTTPIITFVNKLDREGKPPIELLDEVETVLGIACAPITWPIGMGSRLKGIYHIVRDVIYLYDHGKGSEIKHVEKIEGLNNPLLDEKIGDMAQELRDEIELLAAASNPFDQELFDAGELTPVFFGSALNNFGVEPLLDAFVDYAPKPLPRETTERVVKPEEEAFSGFVFKIQANMDPQHRDRVAFLRVCSGHYEKGMRLKHVRLGKEVTIAHALTFMAKDRSHVDHAYPGDIIGLHNHGTIKIGDTFTTGEKLTYTGIPHFAPELFKRVILRDPLKQKHLLKGLIQLSEEGAVQLFRPLRNNDLILGAVGSLQFDVVAHRLKSEYNVECSYDPVQVHTARWVSAKSDKDLEAFQNKAYDNLAIDGADELTYLAPSRVNLQLAEERYPNITFTDTREH